MTKNTIYIFTPKFYFPLIFITIISVVAGLNVQFSDEEWATTIICPTGYQFRANASEQTDSFHAGRTVTNFDPVCAKDGKEPIPMELWKPLIPFLIVFAPLFILSQYVVWYLGRVAGSGRRRQSVEDLMRYLLVHLILANILTTVVMLVFFEASFFIHILSTTAAFLIFSFGNVWGRRDILWGIKK